MSHDPLATQPPSPIETTIRNLVRRVAEANGTPAVLLERAHLAGAVTLAVEGCGVSQDAIKGWITDEMRLADLARPRIVLADGRRPSGGLIQ